MFHKRGTSSRSPCTCCIQTGTVIVTSSQTRSPLVKHMRAIPVLPQLTGSSLAGEGCQDEHTEKENLTHRQSLTPGRSAQDRDVARRFIIIACPVIQWHQMGSALQALLGSRCQIIPSLWLSDDQRVPGPLSLRSCCQNNPLLVSVQ